jgi:hypothetical protein
VFRNLPNVSRDEYRRAYKGRGYLNLKQLNENSGIRNSQSLTSAIRCKIPGCEL